MQKLLYSLHFRGRMSSSANGSGSLRTSGSATSCVVTTTVSSQGMLSEFQPSQGDLAFLDSELRVTGTGSFRQNGTIVFGEASEHVLRFSTIGQGRLAASYEPGTMAGTVTCNIEGGEGQFAAARGFITSNFVLNDSGDFDDFHSGLIFLPE